MNGKTPAACNDREMLKFEKLHASLKGKIEVYVFYLTGSKLNAEDIAQEVLIKIWTKWEHLKDMEGYRLKNYVYASVRNYIVNMERRKEIERKYSNYFIHSHAGIVHDDTLLTEIIHIYRKAINNLPPAEKMVYKFSQDFTYTEIARKVRRSENTVKNQLCSANRSVRNYMSRYFEWSICEN